MSYNASKAGLEGLKYQLASELAAHDIRVNNVILSADPDAAETWFDEMLLGGMARPAAIAPLVVFLAADASWYMTGSPRHRRRVSGPVGPRAAPGATPCR